MLQYRIYANKGGFAMYCENCGGTLGQNGVCPVCGWYKVQAPTNQGYNNQSYNNQAYGGQAGYNNQAYGNQAYNNQQFYNNQAYSGQAGYNNQASYNSQAYNQQAGYNNHASYNNQAYNQQAGYTNQAYANQSQAGYNNQFYNQQAYAYQNYNTTTAKPKKKWPLIAGISSAVVILGVVLAIVLWPDKKDKDPDNNTTEQIVSTTESNTSEPTTTEGPTNIATGDGTKTIMMYIVGSDLESEYNAATSDIYEITTSNFDDENINFIIYTGGTKDWNNPDISDNHNSILKVENGELVLLEHQDKKNMGNADTLSDFMNYCYESYPADQYGLILWNHGGGAFNGYGFDELTNDCLSLMELNNALKDTPFTGDQKLEWIGFDACLMATIEVADALSPYANYLIASQEPEPGCGWDYAFLGEIDKDDTGVDIGTLIVDQYIESTEAMFEASPFSYSDITLSVLDLSQTDEVEVALEDMFAVAKDDLTVDTYNEYAKLRASTKEIAPMYSGEYSYDCVDLYDMADRMGVKYPNESNALKSAVSSMVVYQDANVKKEYGVSIYYPYNAKEYSQYYVPMFKTFDFAPNYSAYIENFRSYLTNTQISTASWDPQTMIPTHNGDLTFTMELTPEQASEVQNAYFVISREDTQNPGDYVFVSMSNQVIFEDTTTVTAPFDGQIIYVQDDTTGQMSEIMYTEQEKTDDYTRYLISSILYNDDLQGEDAVYTYFVLETTPSNPTGTIMGAYPIANLVYGDANEIFPERYEVDVNSFENVAFGYFTHEFTSDEDLTNFNEADWADLSLYYNTSPVSNGFSTVMGGMFPGVDYYGMFIFEDTQGNRHCSNLVPLQ